MFKIDPDFPIPSVDGALSLPKQEIYNGHLALSLKEGLGLAARRLNGLLPKDGSEAMTGALAGTTAAFSGSVTALQLNAIGGPVTTTQFVSTTAPVTKTADFTWALTENWIINNKAGSTCVATLPDPATFVGRMIGIKNFQAQLVNSASANVVALAGGAAAVGILAAVAGRWAIMVSDGTNWQIMAGN